MPGSERDSTEDWLLPEHRTPPTVAELQSRIDEALATARASEAAAMMIGEAALDAAERARRAAELAERAARIAVSVQPRDRPPAGTASAPGKSDSMRDFSERADRIVERLRQIQRLPLAQPVAAQGGGELGGDVAAAAGEPVDRADRLDPAHRSG
jgi:hypothetical protein